MMVYLHYKKARRGYRRAMLGEERWNGVIATKEKARLPLQCWGLHELVVEVWRGIFSRGLRRDDTYRVRNESDGEDWELEWEFLRDIRVTKRHERRQEKDAEMEASDEEEEL
jgi:hypothetical protein